MCEALIVFERSQKKLNTQTKFKMFAMSNDASESVENHAKTINLIRCAFASIYELKIVGLMENKLDTYASLLFYG